MASKVLKVIGRWAKPCVASTLFAWHEYAAKEERKRDFLTRITTQIKNKTSVITIEMWKDAVAKARTERSEEQQLLTVKGKIIWRTLHKIRSCAFENWYSKVEDILNERAKGQSQQAKLQKHAKRMQNKLFLSVFWCWCKNVIALKVQHNTKQNKRIAVERITNRLKSQSLSAAITVWKQQVKDLLFQLQRSNSVTVRQIAAKEALHGISTFTMSSLETIQRKALEMHKSLVQSQTAHVELTAALLTSQQTQKIRQTKMISRILIRMDTQSLAVALQGWCDKMHKLIMVSKANTVRVRWQIATGFSRWNALLVQTRRNYVSTRIFQRIVQRAHIYITIVSFGDWLLQTRARRHKAEACEKVVGQLRHRSVMLSLDSWREHDCKRKFLLCTSATVLRRVNMVFQARVFDSWNQQEHSAKTLRRRSIHAGQRRFTSVLFVSFANWNRTCCHRWRGQLCVRRTVDRVSHGTLIRCCHLWQQQITYKHACNSHALRAVAFCHKLYRRTLRLALLGWANIVQTNRFLGRLIMKFASTCMRKMAALCLMCWADHCQRCKSSCFRAVGRKNKLILAITHVFSVLLRRCLLHWIATTVVDWNDSIGENDGNAVGYAVDITMSNECEAFSVVLSSEESICRFNSMLLTSVCGMYACVCVRERETWC